MQPENGRTKAILKKSDWATQFIFLQYQVKKPWAYRIGAVVPSCTSGVHEGFDFQVSNPN